jgi:ubiquinone/menaquinone biosynthesis C-methylase UbiE
MANDSHLGASSLPEREQGVGFPRLFQFDLPRLKAGKVFPERLDLSGIRRVLDVTCGTGEWAIATARTFPQLEVIGIDGDQGVLDHARTQARASRLDTITFTMTNARPPFDIPSASFDLVNVRFVANLTPLAAWPALVGECLRIVRSEGVIQYTEGDTPITSSPACERLSNMLSEALGQTKHNLFPPIRSGRNFLITPLLQRVLMNAGCKNVQKAIYVTDFGYGTAAQGDIVREYTRVCHLAQPVLHQMGMTTQSEMEQLSQQILSEMQSEEFRGVGFYRTVWGTKP